ncbi:glycoside hydrolase family 13 protein [Gelatoporia subvermispora B]|uniref:alpha-amylase n=1 Tax=Ceriporiopsis subvermispora (strain B) TaxID=914234 RepID=M2QNP4_CERS8|nr:glycoside hydrolase family 13 protein [Gelatoporia subvermispora B]
MLNFFLLPLALIPAVFCATAEQWRGRSIYQVIVDRYALPSGASTTSCDPGDQTWCGGTWNTIRENLDYIENAGFTAIWISPVSQNYEGPRTVYGDAYHGYWIADVTQLNDRFGSADDLKALSDELHRRGMYLMVDVVVNDVMATSTTPDLSTYYFKDESQYHPYCPIDWSNTTSEEDCWLGDTNVPLADLNTTNPSVVEGYTSWITPLVQQFNIDGLRIDAAKHVDKPFWPVFCGAAGVYCIGEVFDDNPANVAIYQGSDALDATLNYPMYGALVNAFAIPGQQNMSALTDMIALNKQLFKDTGLLGNFLEDQDVPRWGNLSVDVQSLYNAMIFTFMSDGIPIVYYGQEQGFHGASDPWNREPLWTSGYANSTAYQLVTTLNQFRNFLVNGTSGWLNSSMEVLTTTNIGIGIMKGDVVTILTNIGSPPQNSSVAVYTPWSRNTALTNILTCQQWQVGSNGTIEMQYTKGGEPAIFAPNTLLPGSGLCGFSSSVNLKSGSGSAQGAAASSAITGLKRPSTLMSAFVLLVLMLFGLFGTVA